MKKTIRFLALALTVFLLISVLPISALAAGVPFSDVTEGSWYYNAVKYCYENDLVNGMSATRFCPQNKLSRAMVATILYRASGSTASGSYSYPDVGTGAWYYSAVAWAKTQGVVNGYPDGKFHPDDSITREQLLSMLYRYAGSPTCKYSLTLYQDGTNVTDYAKNPVGWACACKLITSADNSTMRCNPKGTATRAEFCVMMTNLQTSDRSKWGANDMLMDQDMKNTITSYLSSVETAGYAICEYYGAKNIPLNWALYNVGNTAQPNALSSREVSVLTAKWGEIHTGVLRITAAQLEANLRKYTSYGVADMKSKLSWLYLPEFNSYYTQRSDSNLTPLVCEGGFIWGSGSKQYVTVLLDNSQSGDIFYLNAKGNEIFVPSVYVTFCQDTTTGGLYFVSCTPGS